MKTRTLLLVSTFGLLFSGCVKLDEKRPERNRYVLEADIPEQSSLSQTSDPSSPSLQIARFGTDPKFAGKEFVYRKGDTFESDFYNLFFVNPEEMLAAEISRWLRNNRPRKFRISPFRRIDPDYTLEGDIFALYGDFSSDQPAAILGIRIFLAEETEAGPKLKLSRDYHRRIPLKKFTPKQLIAGWNKALQEILKNIGTDLEKAGPSTP